MVPPVMRTLLEIDEPPNWFESKVAIASPDVLKTMLVGLGGIAGLPSQ